MVSSRDLEGLLNYYLTLVKKTKDKDIFKNNVISLTKPVNLIVEKDSSEMYLPYDYDIDMDNEGKLYSHDENEYNINIDEKKDLTSFNALEYTFKNSYKHIPI